MIRENLKIKIKGGRDVRWVCPVVLWYYARYAGCALDAGFDDLFHSAPRRRPFVSVRIEGPKVTGMTITHIKRRV